MPTMGEAAELLDAASTALDFADDTLAQVMQELAEARAQLRSLQPRFLAILGRFANLSSVGNVDEPAASRIMVELRKIQEIETELDGRLASLEDELPSRDVVGIREAARICQVSFITFKEWVIAGKVPYTMPKGTRLFRRGDLEALATVDHAQRVS